jgi:hypothetical protein
MGVSVSPTNKIERDARTLRMAMARRGIRGRDLSRLTNLSESRISEIRNAGPRPMTDTERVIIAQRLGETTASL